MEIGDLIYILLMIGAVVASIIKKKMDADKKINAPERNVTEVLEDIFPNSNDWETDENNDEGYQEVPVLIDAIPPENIISKKADAYSQKYFTYESNEISGDKPLIHKSLSEDQSEMEYSILVEDEEFDARKAIIYSEILKRPTY